MGGRECSSLTSQLIALMILFFCNLHGVTTSYQVPSIKGNILSLLLVINNLKIMLLISMQRNGFHSNIFIHIYRHAPIFLSSLAGPLAPSSCPTSASVIPVFHYPPSSFLLLHFFLPFHGPFLLPVDYR